MRLSMPSKTTSRVNIKQTLEQALTLLQSKNIDSAYLDAELLLAYVLKKPRSFVLAHPEKTLTNSQVKNYRQLVRKRASHIPLAYLLGHKEFYGLNFVVTKDVLVPRPESELLVDLALTKLQANPGPSLLVDIGTGSGCLLLTTLKKLPKNRVVKGIGLDISTAALRIAQKNAHTQGLKNTTFLRSNLLSSLLKRPFLYKNYQQIVILANLPYLTTKEISQEISISREPRLALDGGKHGLALYKKLAQQISQLSTLGIPLTIICEINPHQQTGLQKIWKQKIIFRKDLGNNVRAGMILINTKAMA